MAVSESRDSERRYISTYIPTGSQIEVRSAVDGRPSRTIGGYAAVFNR